VPDDTTDRITGILFTVANILIVVFFLMLLLDPARSLGQVFGLLVMVAVLFSVLVGLTWSK